MRKTYDKDSYLKELEEALANLPAHERASALAYAEEYFEEAGPDADWLVIEELGSPEDYAEVVRQEYLAQFPDLPEDASTLPDLPEGSDSQRRTTQPGGAHRHSLWWILGAIFALPIALPVALFFALLILTLFLLVFTLILCLGVLVLALGACVIAAFSAGCSLLLQDIYSALFLFGVAAAGAGLFLLGFSLVRWLARRLFPGLKNWVWNVYRKLRIRYGKGK